jgi:hypothetical protein
VLAICILKDMRRSVLRASVSLVLAALAIPLAILLTHNTLDRVTLRLLHVADLERLVAPLIEAFPSLDECIIALVHMVIASEIYGLVFLILLAVFGLISRLVCRAIEQKKPALAKKSKPIGAVIGIAFGLVVIVALMAPTAGYAAEAPEIIHILGEYEQITHEGQEDISDEALAVQQNAQKTADTFLLKAVRALGGKAIFRATTTVEIDGVTTDLYREFHSLDTLGAKLAVLSAVPIKDYQDAQYETVGQVADVIEESALLRVLSAEGLSSLSRAWRSGEPFLGVSKPADNDVLEIVIDVVLKRFENTTKDTVADDIQRLAPAVATAIKAFNIYQSMNSTPPSAPSDPTPSDPTPSTPTPDQDPAIEIPFDPDDGGETDDKPAGGNQPTDGSEPPASSPLMDTINTVVDMLGEDLENEETKSLAIEIGVGVIAKEIEKFFVTDKREDLNTPTEGGADDAFAAGIAELLPPDVVITQEDYDGFMEGLSNIAVSGSLGKPAQDAVEDVKTVRDEIGINLSDELCEELVNAVQNSPYADLFK